MFAAKRQNYIRATDTSPRRTHRDQFTHTFQIKRMEWIFGIDALLHIGRHKPPGIIARLPIGHLGQIVGADRQKFRMFRDILCP